LTKFAIAAVLSLSLLTVDAFGWQTPLHTPGQATVFIVAPDGFDTDITAAIQKKKTPITVVENKSHAEYILEADGMQNHDETTGGKIARCLFLDCIGMNGASAVSVKLIRTSNDAVVWAYQVRKSMSGPTARQSLSEAIAKHLKNDYLNRQ
jgi:hypothetical protein